MKALDRKLLRDLRLMWSQALTIALVVASGVAGFITTFSAYDALAWSRDRYYTESRFADVFASLKRAPLALLPQLAALPGAAQLETQVTQVVPLTLSGVTAPVIGRLIGLDPQHLPQLNQIHLRRGRMLSAQPPAGAIEVLVSEGFANARQLQPGDHLHALLNGRHQALVIVGIALSPEYIFAGLAGSPDLRGFGVFWMDRNLLATAYDMQGAFNQVAVRLAPQANPGPLIDGLDRLLAPFGGTFAHGRDEQLSHRILDSEIREQRVLGTVLPSIFLAVAAFLLHVVLGRQISSQREQIATLKALGYDTTALARHYLLLVLVIVLVGLLLGLGVGSLLGHGFTSLYADVFRFPELHYRVRPALVLAAAGMTGAAALLAAWHAIAATVRLPPAQAMRAPAPAVYRPSLIEAWGLQPWFTPASRMVLRSLQRRPWRAALTVLGIASAIAILICGAFWRDTIALMLHTQFSQVLRGNLTVSLREPTAARALREVARLPHVQAVEATRNVNVRLVNGAHHWRGSVQGRAAQPELHRIVDVAQHAHRPSPQGLLLTVRLARRLQLQVGQTVQVEWLEGRRETVQLPVVGTISEMMGLGAYIERHALNHLLHEDDLVTQLTVAVTPGQEDGLLQQLKGFPQVGAAFSKTEMRRNIEQVTARNVLVFSAILSVFATIIAVGVVYNHARIALAERAWELASLRVLGFTRGEASAQLLGELALEIALALPLGLLGGRWLAQAIVELIQTDEFYFPLVIAPATYAYAALCVILAGALSALVVRRRIDTLDLVGVLKTRE